MCALPGALGDAASRQIASVGAYEFPGNSIFANGFN